MKHKSYAANILRHWPMREQLLKLATAPGGPVEHYQDDLKPRALKAHSPTDLKERAELLRRTNRKGGGEIIYVASLGVLAWVAEDFMTAMGAAASRNATVVSLDTGRTIPPTATAGELAEALSEFLAARRRHQTSGGRLAGVVASRAIRMADTAARAALIADDWHGVTAATDALLLRAGKVRRGSVVPMAWATAVRLLGRRPTPAKMLAAKQMEMRPPDGTDDFTMHYLSREVGDGSRRQEFEALWTGGLWQTKGMQQLSPRKAAYATWQYVRQNPDV